MNDIKSRRVRRHTKILAKMQSDKKTLRLLVRRSSLHIYGILIDDAARKTLFEISDISLGKQKLTKVEKARAVGKTLAERAVKEKIKRVTFDRGGYLYHGRVKALAEGARQGGLTF